MKYIIGTQNYRNLRWFEIQNAVYSP